MGQRILRLDQRFFADIFGTGWRLVEVTKNALPSDIRICNVMLEFSTNNVVLKLESAEWDASSEGHSITEITPWLRQVHVPDRYVTEMMETIERKCEADREATWRDKPPQL